MSIDRVYEVVFFFFSSRRRHTRYWRDWSSDVCSSDLAGDEVVHGPLLGSLLGQSHRLQVSFPQPLQALGALGGGGPRGAHQRSEERRVGKECRSRWSPYH